MKRRRFSKKYLNFGRLHHYNPSVAILAANAARGRKPYSEIRGPWLPDSEPDHSCVDSKLRSVPLTASHNPRPSSSTYRNK